MQMNKKMHLNVTNPWNSGLQEIEKQFVIVQLLCHVLTRKGATQTRDNDFFEKQRSG